MRSRTSRAPLLCCGGPPAVGSTGPSKGTSWPGKFWVRAIPSAGSFDYLWKILSPAAKRRAVDMLVNTMSVSKRLACRAVGLARSTYARTPIAETPADPDAALRAALRTYAGSHPLHGFRRAWAHLRHDEGFSVNKKKVHRLWKEEGLQVRIYWTCQGSWR